MRHRAFASALAAATLVVALPRGSHAADAYPSAPDEKDKLCEVIGEAPNLSVPPRDRLWFRENCTCVRGDVGCGALQSARFSSRLEAAKRRAEAAATLAELGRWKAKQRTAMIAPERKATAALRAEYWECDADPDAKSCKVPAAALEDACRTRGLYIDPNGIADDDCYRKD
jgi:hypothetical protein